jgi:hypothetical protein
MNPNQMTATLPVFDETCALERADNLAGRQRGKVDMFRRRR